MLLDAAFYNKDEEKRRLYVGLTRAKTNLLIHVVGDSLRWIKARMDIRYSTDTKEYEEPSEMEIQLGFHDVFLGFFKSYKNQILSLRSGDLLDSSYEYLLSNGKKILKYSMAFNEKLQTILSKGYSIVKSEIRYISAWRDKDHPEEEEIAVVLPNIYLRKSTPAKEEIIEAPSKETKETQVVFNEEKPDTEENDILPSVEIRDVNELSSEEFKQIKKTKLFEALKEFRAKTAEENKVPPYVVASDKTLAAIVLAMPKNKEELLACYGFGKRKYEQIGESILSIVAKYA